MALCQGPRGIAASREGQCNGTALGSLQAFRSLRVPSGLQEFRRGLPDSERRKASYCEYHERHRKSGIHTCLLVTRSWIEQRADLTCICAYGVRSRLWSSERLLIVSRSCAQRARNWARRGCWGRPPSVWSILSVLSAFCPAWKGFGRSRVCVLAGVIRSFFCAKEHALNARSFPKELLTSRCCCNRTQRRKDQAMSTVNESVPLQKNLAYVDVEKRLWHPPARGFMSPATKEPGTCYLRVALFAQTQNDKLHHNLE